MLPPAGSSRDQTALPTAGTSVAAKLRLWPGASRLMRGVTFKLGALTTVTTVDPVTPGSAARLVLTMKVPGFAGALNLPVSRPMRAPLSSTRHAAGVETPDKVALNIWI